jgi:Domain of unknown function (DUF1844)
MSDTPKFEVIDRRKMKAEEEQEHKPTPAVQAEPEPPAGPHVGPRLVVPETEAEPATQVFAGVDGSAQEAEPELPTPPTPEESRQQEVAYEASARRLEDLIRAQNPAVGAQPPVGFEHLVQQLYISAMVQMGAGVQEGQRPRVDILGARQTIDLLGVLAEKTKGNLSPIEDRMMQTVLFEARMAFNELTSMISLQGMPAPPPKPAKH